MRSVVLRESDDRLARRERVLDMRFAGIEFRNYEGRRAAPFMSALAEDLYEAFTFAHLAVGAGIDDLVEDIQKCSPPKADLLVRMKDGSSVYVEVGRVRSQKSARRFGEIEALNKGLWLAARADLDLMHRLQSRHISFGMVTVLSKRERAAVVSELVTTLGTMRFDDSQPWMCFDPSLPPTPAKRCA